MFILQKQAKIEKIQAKVDSIMKTLNKKIFNFFILFLYRHARDGKTRDSRDGKSNVPYFQTHNRDGTLDCPVPAVPCFQ